MTQNQIAFQGHLENVRHNLATETETNRHNVVGEVETNRHNVQDEAIRWDANRINEEHFQRADAAAFINASAAQSNANARYITALAMHEGNLVHAESNRIQEEWNNDYGNILRFEAAHRAAGTGASSYQGMMNAQTNQMNAQTNATNATINQQNADTNAKNADTNRYNFYNNVVQDTTRNLINWSGNPFIQKGIEYLFGGNE